MLQIVGFLKISLLIQVIIQDYICHNNEKITVQGRLGLITCTIIKIHHTFNVKH